MTILLGLILLGASLVVAVVGIMTSTAGPGMLPGEVTVLGVQAHVLPGGNLFVLGIEVGVVGMLGLRLAHGDVQRRLAARRLGRLRTHLQHDTHVVTRDRDRLARELLEQRAGSCPGKESPPDHLAVLAGPGHGR